MSETREGLPLAYWKGEGTEATAATIKDEEKTELKVESKLYGINKPTREKKRILIRHDKG